MIFGGENAESYYDEGVTASVKGDLDTAVQYFHRALQLDARLSPAMYQLGKCFQRQGKAMEAVTMLERALRLDPSLHAAQLELGYALLDAGVPERAQRLFETILDERPGTVRATLGLAYCAFDQANWASAALLAQSVAQSGSMNFATVFLWGRAANLAGLPEAAEALLSAEQLIEAFIETTPDQPQGYFFRGEIFFLRQDFAKALADYGAAEQYCRPEQFYTAFNSHFVLTDVMAKRGLCLQRLARMNEAAETGRQILAIDSNHRMGQMLAKGSSRE